MAWNTSIWRRFNGAEDPHRVLVGAGLQHDLVRGGAQVRRLVPVDVQRRRVVAQHDQLGALQRHHAVGLGPAAVVAQAHADLDVVGFPHAEAQVADFEELLLQVLERRLGLVVGMAGQVDLAVLADDPGLAVHQDGGVELAPFRGQLGVAQVEADAEFARGVEQRLHVGVGHALFEEAIDRLGVFHPVARKESGQRQFGKDHELRLAGRGLAHHLDEAADHHRAGVGQVDGAHLGDREVHFARMGCVAHDVSLRGFYRYALRAVSLRTRSRPGKSCAARRRAG